MARKKGNPLSGKFRDPPQEGTASTPDHADQNSDQAKLTDVPDQQQAGQGEAPAEQTEVPTDQASTDGPDQEQAGQDEATAEQTEAPTDHASTDGPDQEQAGQDEATAEQTEVPADHASADGPDQEQPGQDEATAEQTEAPADHTSADGPDQEQAGQGEAPTGQTEAPADHTSADGPDQEQAGQGEATAEQTEAPADQASADGPDQEQAGQGEATAYHAFFAGPNQEWAGQAGILAQPAHPEARFVRLDLIQSLPGTFVKDTPREDYSDLIDSIKKDGLEQPIILRDAGGGTYQLVDGFHRCEAMKRAGVMEIKAEVYDISPLEASRYRREHRTRPDLPIPGKLLPAHPAKEEPPADKDAPTQDEEEFEVPENFTLPITKEGQSELVTTLKVSDIHPFEGHPFNVLDNKDMWDLVESVKRYGVLEPVMVINRPAGGYEMVSGHRRMRACQLAGVQTIPAIVRNLDRDEAIIAMVDANLKREKISPMEMVRALAMKTEAMRRKVGRRSKAEIATGIKPLTVDEELARQTGESVANIQRYKTLNKLVPKMQELVDSKRVPLNTGADIAQLKPEEQEQLADAILKEDKVPTGAQAKEMKKQSKEGTLTTKAIKQAVAPTVREENPPLKIMLVEEDLRPYFPDKRTTVPDVKTGIFEALALRKKLQERQAAKAQQTAAKDDAKPPDKPAAGSSKNPSDPTAGGRGKKPVASKPKKTTPTR